MAQRTGDETSSGLTANQPLETVNDEAAGSHTDPPPPLDVTSVQSYSSIEDVPYRRDLYTPTGAGAFGCVFRAVMEPNQISAEAQVFAVKEIKFSTHKEKSNILGEVAFLRRCQHPNILRMTEIYVINHPGLANAMYIVTSPWAPVTLLDFFKDLMNSENSTSSLCPWYVPRSEQPWTTITGGCISAVQYLHKHNIRHRDIKPENILLHCRRDQDVEPVIADFGISKDYIMNAATTFNGTYEWMAPEWINKSGSTPKVDVFTLGACFSIIEAIVLAGKDGLDKIWKIGLESGSCQFAANLENILAYLAILKPKSTDWENNTQIFQVLLIEWVECMIVRVPEDRATMDDLQMLCQQYDPHFRLIPTLNPARFGTQREMNPWTSLVHILRPGQPEIPAFMTIDTGSNVSLISLDILTRLGIKPDDINQKDWMILVTASGDRFTLKSKVLLQWRAKNPSSRVYQTVFFVMNRRDFSFPVILGTDFLRTSDLFERRSFVAKPKVIELV